MLNSKQQSLALLGKYVATGDQGRLKAMLNQAFDSGSLTINDAKDAMVQLYAYCGFPRSLNALATLMAVVSERSEKGLATEAGRAASALPANFDSLQTGKATQTQLVGQEVKGGLFDFAPEANRYLQAHLFGDIFASDLLNWQEREILTLGALGATADTVPQYGSHKGIAQHNGLSDGQIAAIEQLIADEGAVSAPL